MDPTPQPEESQARMETCARCVFYVAPKGDWPPGWEDPGKCHRHPPTLVSVALIAGQSNPAGNGIYTVTSIDHGRGSVRFDRAFDRISGVSFVLEDGAPLVSDQGRR